MAGRKRKAQRVLDGQERTLYESFAGSAAALSGLYAQAQEGQREAYRLGQGHALERVARWADGYWHSNHHGDEAVVMDQMPSSAQGLGYAARRGGDVELTKFVGELKEFLRLEEQGAAGDDTKMEESFPSLVARIHAARDHLSEEELDTLRRLLFVTRAENMLGPSV